MDVTIAAFDVDHTLTVRDCVFPFMVKVAGWPRMLVGTLVRLPRILPLVLKRDRNGLKALFVEIAFAGRSVDVVEQLGVRFADKVVRGWMRSDVAARLRWHQDQGHVVLLVSASLAPYLEPLGDMLEVDAVLCTELESSGGAYTGKISGVNCRAHEKVQRISRWAAEAGIGGDIHLAYAYGDSAGDAQMLALADSGVNVSETEMVAA